MVSHPLIGQKAPQITLPSTTAESYELNPGTTGRPLVVFFYPAAGTYGCTKESCSFRDALNLSETFKRTKCEVVGISGDTVEKQKAFAEDNALTYPLLCDTEGKAKKLYSVSRGLMNMSDGRATFVIDANGTVVDVYESVMQFYEHRKFAERVLATLPDAPSS